ncbi:MAG: beta strand repeat-containing protein [Thermoplasmata archaeon]
MNRVARRQGHLQRSGALATAAVAVCLLMVLSGAVALNIAGRASLPSNPASLGTASSDLRVGSVPPSPSGASPAALPARAASPARDDLSSLLRGTSLSPDAKAPPSVAVTPSVGNVSTQVTLNASGYPGAVAITISYVNDQAKQVTACSGETTGKGYFVCSIAIPPLPAGAHTFTGTDVKGHTGTGTFNVQPQVILTPSQGLVGTPITIQGTGFAAQFLAKAVVHDTVTVNWSGGVLCNNLAMSGAGGFNCTLGGGQLFTMPAVPSGPHRFYALDNRTDRGSSAFTVIPGLSVGPTYGMDGTVVTFTGTGFAASSGITVKWSQGTACGSPTRSQGTGGFTCTYQIPLATPGGSYAFTANDTGKGVASATYVITFIDVAPASGPVGTNVTLTEGGFAPYSVASITWNGALACAGTPTSAFGTLVCHYKIPATTAGPHVFNGTDAKGDSAVTSFTVEPALSVSPGYGPAKSPVIFTGTGFAGSSLTTVSWLNGSVCSRITNSTGAFSCPFSIPPSTPGAAYTFTGQDAAKDVGTTTFIVTYLTVNPGSGPVGTTITVSGAGYAPRTGFTVSWGSKTVCSGTTTRLGAFASGNCTVPFKVPYTTGGPHLLEAVDKSLAGNTATASFVVTPQLTFTPKGSAQVFSNLTFIGTGYNASSPVTVTWSGPVACTSVTAANGAFNCTPYQLPKVVAGSYVFTGTDTGGATASATVTVGADLIATPSSSPVNGTVRFVATAFAPHSPITISWAGGVACSGGTTSAQGWYACPYPIPPIPEGVYTFTASDASSHTANALVTVQSLLTESPASGPTGTLVTFGGTGFLGNALVRLSWTGGTACRLVSSPTGGFTCSFAIPNVPSGDYVFTATNGSGTTSVTFTVLPSLVVSPTRGPVGTTLTFLGAGYPALQTVQVGWSAGPICSHATSTTGGFSCSFTLPATSLGVHTFWGNDTETGSSSKATFTVVPQLTVSPVAGPVGTLLEFNGSGFSPVSGVTVSWTAGSVCSATTADSGSFQCTVSLPSATFGVHVFKATDGSGHTANATFSVTPQLILTPSSGLVGTKVALTGSGYGSAVAVTVNWAGGTACSNTTTAAGGFACKYTIPVGTAGGVYPFTGADGTGDTAVATFTVITSLSVAPARGMAGTSVTFSGSGYAASSTVSVTWAHGTACSVPTSISGTFSCVYAIPSHTPGGAYTFTGKDAQQDTASTTFVVTYLTVSPNSGTAPAAVEFAAGGYAPSTTFTITWSGGPAACAGATTTSGTFACSYTVPAHTPPGTYAFTGTDGSSNQASANFTVLGVPSVTVPAPNHPGADVGQTVIFSTVASGGSGSYPTYTWTESSVGLNCALVNAPSISCVPSAAGHYTLNVTVTDSNGIVSPKATSATFAVSPALSVGAPAMNRTSADVGQSVTFSTTIAGGSGGFTITWSGLPTGCGGTTVTITCTPTAPDLGGTVSVTVSDSNANSVTPETLTINIYADPTVGTPTASLASVDANQTVSFAAIGAGGSGGLTYIWSGLPAPCSGTGSVVTCDPTATGPATIKVTVVDSNGYHVTSSGSLAFTVYVDPSVAKPTASRASVDVGQKVTFTANPKGGSGGDTYVWSNLPAGCSGTSSSVTCTTTTEQLSLSVSVTVTDSNGFSVTSPVLKFNVYADPSAGPPTASIPGADVGQRVTFSADVSGGSDNFTFAWHGLPSGCGGTTETVVCIVANGSGVGLYAISYTASDSNGLNSTSSALEFRFSPDPTVTTPTASPSSVDVNQSVTFSASAGGGSGGLTYSWNGLPEGCAGTSAVVVCRPGMPFLDGNITVTVTDLNGFEVTSGVLVFTVWALPHANPPTASSGSADVGQSVTFSVVVTGGSGGLTYTWSGLPAGCAGATPSVVCADLAGSGTYSIMVTVEDSNGASNTSVTLLFTVYTDPAVTTPTASPPSVDVGQTVTFTVTGSGGSGELTYAWVGLPSGCGEAPTTPTATCTPTAALASTSITVTVTDSNGFSVTSQPLTFTVDAALTVTVTANPSSLLEGKSVTFTATASSGSGGYAFTWTGLPPGCGGTTATISCQPTASGTFHVSVSVRDTNLGSATATTTVTVNSSFLGLPSAEGLALLAGGILAAIVVALLLVFLLVRRRRRSAAPPPPWTPSTPYAPSAPATAAPPAEWTPPPPPGPPSAPEPTEEPSPWEVPPPEPGPGENGSPPSGG